MTSFGKGVFAGVIKDLEMRSTWVFRVGLKSNRKYPLEKRRHRTGEKARRGWRQRWEFLQA